MAADSAVIQWKNPTQEQPWLSRLEIVPHSQNLALQTARLDRLDPDYPSGVRVIFTKQGEGTGWIQVRLAQGYGFLISDHMLDRHPYLWVRDMGIYISRLGTWAETVTARERNARTIGECLKKPFVSCAEKYFQWTGFVEHERQLDEKIWDFVKEKQEWPLDVRAVDHIAATPEVDASYFTDRFPDLKCSRTYLGWPDHNDEFILWNNGRIGISSRSVGGDPRHHPDTPWQPRARGFTFQFGVGTAPLFREYGDDHVKQSLQQGYQLVVDTEWIDGGVAVRQTNFAYPLESETIKSGVEPLLVWTRLQFESQTARRIATSLGVEFTDEDFGGNSITGNDMPLPNLSDLTWRAGGFYLLGDLILTSDPALTFEEIPTTKGRKRFRAPIELDPAATKEFDFAGPYRPLSPARLAEIRALGFARAHERTLRFWNEAQTRGASIRVPDILFNNLYRTFLPRVMISSDPPRNPSLPDEPFWACHTTEYLSRDQIHNFLYTLYSQSTTTLARETLTTYEHRSHGKGRVFELTGWAAGYWFRNFTDMLARTVGNQLWLLQATPRRWLKDGESIQIQNLQTEFGPLTLSVTSSLQSGTIRAQIDVPTRRAPELIRIRFRVPDGKQIRGVTIDSRQWLDFDSKSEWVEFPGSLKTADVVVRF